MDILNLINNDKWEEAILQVKNVFNIIDDKNLFHYACMRGKSIVIDKCVATNSIQLYDTDSHGNTGAHLLGINGWNDALINLVKIKPDFLKLKNKNDEFVFNIVANKFIILKQIIQIMIHNKFESCINFVRASNKTFILDVIKMCQKNNKYTEILEILHEPSNILWNIPISNPPLTYSIKKSYIDVSLFLINNLKLDHNIKDEHMFNPLSISILMDLKKITNVLLKFDDIDVNFGGRENKYVPLILCFKKGFFDIAKIIMSKDNVNYENNDNLLNTPIFYLLYTIYSNEVLLKDKNVFNIVSKVISKSNLLHTNFNNETPLLILAKTKLWNHFYDVLKNSHIDVNTFNKSKENVLQYIDDSEINKFVKLIDNQLKKGSVTYLKQNKIILPTNVYDVSNGIFNSDRIHNITYLLYILKQYDVSIPLQFPIIEKQSWDTYKLNLTLSEYEYEDPIISTLLFNYNEFYGIAPHCMFWRNKTFYYIDPNITFYLKRALAKQSRFVVMKLTLSPHISVLHANMIIYDKQTNRLTRFEPYGDWDIVDSYNLDKKILETFKSSLDSKQIQTLKYIRPSEYLDKAKFQSVSLGDNPDYQNLGDPAGYCLAWSYWFLELKLLNPDIDEKSLIHNAFNKIINDSNNLNNPMLYYIRGYAKHLDNKKNDIFKQIGVDSQDYYRLSYDTKFIMLLSNFVKQYVINKI